MEFAVIGVSPSTLAGSHPLQPWGQDAEVLSGFPSAEGKDQAGERGKGDGSFVQGLGEFCFPSGASISLAEGGAAVSRFLSCVFVVVVFRCLSFPLAISLGHSTIVDLGFHRLLAERQRYIRPTREEAVPGGQDCCRPHVVVGSLLVGGGDHEAQLAIPTTMPNVSERPTFLVVAVLWRHFCSKAHGATPGRCTPRPRQSNFPA